MYRVEINWQDFGTVETVAQGKARVKRYAGMLEKGGKSVYASIRRGSKPYATYETGSGWERYVSCAEIRRKKERERLEAAVLACYGR